RPQPSRWRASTAPPKPERRNHSERVKTFVQWVISASLGRGAYRESIAITHTPFTSSRRVTRLIRNKHASGSIGRRWAPEGIVRLQARIERDHALRALPDMQPAEDGSVNRTAQRLRVTIAVLRAIDVRP